MYDKYTHINYTRGSSLDYNYKHTIYSHGCKRHTHMEIWAKGSTIKCTSSVKNKSV